MSSLTILQLFSFVILLLCCTVNAKITVTQNPTWNSATGTARPLSVTYGSLTYSAAGKEILASDATQLIDGLRYAFGVPKDNSPGIYLGVFPPNQNLSAIGTQLYSNVLGAVAEMFFSFSSLMVYYDNDGIPGFQYSLGNPVDCSEIASGNLAIDCFVPSDNIDLKGLSWNIISENATCPSGYDSSCLVWHFTMTGNYGGSAGIPVSTITFTIATHPVLVDYNGKQFEVTPNKGKFTMNLSYPWVNRSSTLPNPKVGLLMINAGKSIEEGAVTTGAVTWAPAGTTKTVFKWDSTAIVGTASQTTLIKTITGTSIQNFTCANCTGTAAIFPVILKFAVDVFSALGWKSQMLFFAWENSGGSSVYWDPTVESVSATTQTPMTSTSGVNFITYSFFIMLFNIVVHWF